MRNNDTNSGATSAPSAARGMQPVGHGTWTKPCDAARSASAPPLEIVTTVPPASSAPCVIESVSSVLPEYETAKTSVCGPTNAGVRYCFRTVTGHREHPAGDRREHVAADPRATHAEHHDVADVGGGRQIVATAHLARELVRRRQLLRQPRDRVEEPQGIGRRRWPSLTLRRWA